MNAPDLLNRSQAKVMGLKLYHGKVCAKHPEGKGERRIKRSTCIYCDSARKRRPENREKTRLRSARWYSNPDNRARQLEYHRTPKGKQVGRNTRIRAVYGMEPADYQRILAAQSGCCAVCGSDTPNRKGSRHFSIDHCHITQKVRGLLCSPCNLALGLLKESPDRIKSLLTYIETRT